MNKETKSFVETLSLQRLQAGENVEWTLFMGYFYDKLIRYARWVTGKPRFEQDVASNALADIYVARMTFGSVEHMVAHMFSIARYECFNLLSGKGDFVMSDGMLLKMDQYLIHTYDEKMTLTERAQYEQWKDTMLKLLYKQALRLPQRWRDFIFVYIKYGRGEIAKYHREEAKTNGNTERAVIFQRLKDMIEYQNSDIKGADQLADLRATFKHFTRKEKAVFAEATRGLSIAEIGEKLSMTYRAVVKSLGRCIRKLRKVWNDPMMSPHLKHLPFVRSIQDPEVKQIVKEEILDKAEMDTGEMLLNRYNREQIIDILTLRDQENLSWRAIAKRMNGSRHSVEKAYKENQTKTPKFKPR